MFEEVRLINDIMADFPGTWGIAGGWAIDLFLKRKTRVHGDVDIVILRHDQHVLFTFLHDIGGWDLHFVKGDRSVPWHNEHLEIPIHELHAEALLGHAPGFEILLNDSDPEETTWFYRRDFRVTLPLDRLVVRNKLDIPFIAPEVVLLYQSKYNHHPQCADLIFSMVDLGFTRRSWLLNALRKVEPDHPWIDILG